MNGEPWHRAALREQDCIAGLRISGEGVDCTVNQMSFVGLIYLAELSRGSISEAYFVGWQRNLPVE
jgi:hypothetical protein